MEALLLVSFQDSTACASSLISAMLVSRKNSFHELAEARKEGIAGIPACLLTYIFNDMFATLPRESKKDTIEGTQLISTQVSR